MTTLTVEARVERASEVVVTAETLAVDLLDGRTISVPTAWFPRLVYASPDERDNWRLIGGGDGIHWANLDEDVSVEGLIAGRASEESQESLAAWLKSREESKDSS